PFSYTLGGAAGVSGMGAVRFTGGTVAVNAPDAVSATTIAGGTANFNQAVTLPTLTFSSGNLGGTGAVDVTNPFTWSTGLLAATGDNGVLSFGRIGVAFTNAGTFVEQGGTGTTTVGGVPFTNTGTVDVRTGTLQISSGANFTNFASNTLTGGTYRVLANATLDL